MFVRWFRPEREADRLNKRRLMINDGCRAEESSKKEGLPKVRLR